MSFLNPVNEPVLRFKSTDAGAPQINYNARVAGDVKAVLKACLVTGYGAVASAGWTAENEVSNVIEFVSPSAAMSDYRLGIDDTSTSSTTWYYQYQDARVNPSYNAPAKSFPSITAAHASNGWQMLVTERGILFIELLQSSVLNEITARITYWGNIKSALTSTLGANIAFFNIGHGATLTSPPYFYSTSYTHLNIGGLSGLRLGDVTPFSVGAEYTMAVSVMDIVSSVYVYTPTQMVGQIPAIMTKVVNQSVGMYGVADTTLDTRPVFKVTLGNPIGNAAGLYARGRVVLLYTDFWEY